MIATKRIVSSVVLVAALAASGAACACDLLPVGRSLCQQLCREIYVDGIPREVCMLGAPAPQAAEAQAGAR
ncbi:hypothetical protein ACFFJB_09095 [Camelimonas abortus]|uniref:Lipoprotein n=1 Tax=Camelimonas abortus TaxID=1017184 RepID=A0ABV7LDW5_9HYPH